MLSERWPYPDPARAGTPRLASPQASSSAWTTTSRRGATSAAASRTPRRTTCARTSPRSCPESRCGRPRGLAGADGLRSLAYGDPRHRRRLKPTCGRATWPTCARPSGSAVARSTSASAASTAPCTCAWPLHGLRGGAHGMPAATDVDVGVRCSGRRRGRGLPRCRPSAGWRRHLGPRYAAPRHLSPPRLATPRHSPLRLTLAPTHSLRAA